VKATTPVAREEKTQQDRNNLRARHAHISAVIATGATPPKQGITTMLKQMMRPQTAVAVLALSGLALFYAGGARADEQWCAHSGHSNINCGFATFAQCQADISGLGGMCSPNPASE
jgi:Protein of unknown function (DUF3551)